jgi:hypothetical protein
MRTLASFCGPHRSLQIHLAAELAEKTWKAAIDVAGSRVRFFNNLRALTAYLLFPSWDNLLKTLAFQVAPPIPS